MVVDEIVNLTNEIIPDNLSFLQGLPPEIFSRLGGLITILKAAGIIFIGYLVFLLIRGFFGWRRGRRINSMYHKINEMDIKLDLLLKEKGLRVTKEEPKIVKKEEKKEKKERKKKK